MLRREGKQVLNSLEVASMNLTESSRTEDIQNDLHYVRKKRWGLTDLD